ncbi:hypothetical protein HMPREF3148_04335 [Corynebacterium sp. HMSC05D08]|uniref:hypothetical protein n=1 Tax=Corynebacterium sp. HMSC05D08 TaxID=1581116 RepID=UPI0008A153EE|nr:hypothetical protein [Corynebacterium sp. HMSC05D08]OFT64108.1 hypothetical protein HMPREF3148_04335 [Corynebacterium sp. HMSC05D08]
MSTSKNSPFAGGGFGGSGFAGGGNGIRPLKNPHKDPFEQLGEPTGDLQKDSDDEVGALSEALDGFKKRMKKERNRFSYAVDAGYWAGLCFKTSEDLDAFLQAVAPINLYRGHVDGYELAEKLGIDVDWPDGR